jgi:hypothetical protein
MQLCSFLSFCLHVLDNSGYDTNMCEDNNVPLFTEKPFKDAGGMVMPRMLAA